MLLKNSKVVPLGGRKFLGRFFMLPVQMSDDGQAWQDIKPRLVRDTDGWHIEGAPFYAEVKDNGNRLFCPDKNTRSTYLSLPSISLIRNLSKNLVSRSAILDRENLPTQISMPTAWGEIRFIFRNDGLFFHVLFNQAPPRAMKDRITLDIDTVGIDIAKALSGQAGWRIPRPRLIDSSSEPIERFLDWSLKAGQLELGFDLTGLKFPVLLKNATFTVGASTDDGYRLGGAITGFYPAGDSIIAGAHFSSPNQYYYDGFCRYTGVSIPAGSTINSAFETFICRVSYSNDTVNTNVLFENANNPAAVTSYDDYTNRAKTAAVAWDAIPAWTAGTSYNTPSLVAPLQAVVDAQAGTGSAVQIFWMNDGSSTGISLCIRRGSSWDDTVYNPPVLTATWTEAGGQQYFQNAGDGSIAMGGGIGGVPSLIKQTQKPNIGGASINIAATVNKGWFVSAGNASMTIAGAVVKQAGKLTGNASMNIAGTVTKVGTFGKSVGNAAMAIAGSVTKQIAKPVGNASMSIAGTVAKTIGKVVGGAAMNIAGVLAAGLIMFRNVGDGTVAIAGTVGKAIGKSVGNASMSIAGAWQFAGRVFDILSSIANALWIKPSPTNPLTITSTIATGLIIKSTIAHTLTITSTVATGLTIDSAITGGG